MATNKRTRPRKIPTTSQFLRFPQVKGKVVDRVEIDPGVEAITIIFEDKTVLSFAVEAALTVFPEYSSWKTGNARTIKRWRAMNSGLSMVKWI